MASSAILSNGTNVQIATGTGGAKTTSAIQLGYPTIVTSAAHGLTVGTVVAAASFAGADAALLNGQSFIVKYATTNTVALDVDTTGKTVTAASATLTPTTYSAIGNVKKFNGPDGTAAEIDVTNLDSVAHEIIMGLPDGGTISFDTDTDDSNAGQSAAYLAWQNRTSKSFKLNLSSGKVLSFTAYVKKYARTGGVDETLKTSIDLRVTGAITLA